MNRWLIRLSRSLFSYQIFIVARPTPSLEWLLQRAVESSEKLAAKPVSVRTMPVETGR